MATSSWMREYQDGQLVPGTPYRVVRLIGAGGMGSVYEVEHVELGRRYVLKSLLRSLATRDDLIARMRNEWRALGKLRHPNIVDVINAGITQSHVPYFVMEFLDGETVRDRLERRGQLSAGEAVRIAQGTLLGLAAAHAIGVIHRDVKPANVFLTRDGGVKVLDFGIAQTRPEGVPKITGRGLAIGTPRYMSPEQAAGEQADARSDVYAVGLLLYEMLTGEGPFDDLTDATQQMLAHLHRPPRPLSQMVEVPLGLETVVERALSKSPTLRPRSAEYMAAELMPFSSAATPTGSRRGTSVSTPTPAPIALPIDIPPAPALSRAWEVPTDELKSLSHEAPLRDERRFRAASTRRIIAGLGAGALLVGLTAAGGVFWARIQNASDHRAPVSAAAGEQATLVKPRVLPTDDSLGNPRAASPAPAAPPRPDNGPAVSSAPRTPSMTLPRSSMRDGVTRKVGPRRTSGRPAPADPKPTLDVSSLPPSGL